MSFARLHAGSRVCARSVAVRQELCQSGLCSWPIPEAVIRSTTTLLRSITKISGTPRASLRCFRPVSQAHGQVISL